MKTEFTDVSETQKTISIEIPTDVVDAEFDRVARGYTKQARLPGFRPGKVPQTLIKQRFREQILHDVMHGLIPRAVEEALQERGIEPVDTPNVKDVELAEGRPLKFTAAFETVPPFDPGDLSSITLRRPSVAGHRRSRRRHAAAASRSRGKVRNQWKAAPVADDDAVVLDLDRTDPDGQVDHRDGVTVQLGAPGNPPGFDAQLIGLNEGDAKTFAIRFPESYPVAELANTEQTYCGDGQRHPAARAPRSRRRVREGRRAVRFAERAARPRSPRPARKRRRTTRSAQVRSELFRQLSQRIPFELPASLVEREMDRRLEEFARQLASQNVDPRQAGIDWGQFREAQREPARNAVASALALDEIARREQITVTPEDVDKEIERFAARAGRTPAALRAQLEKEGGISRLYAGLRREKAVDLALSRAKMAGVAGNRQVSGRAPET